jgi:hypothetical protein
LVPASAGGQKFLRLRAFVTVLAGPAAGGAVYMGERLSLSPAFGLDNSIYFLLPFPSPLCVSINEVSCLLTAIANEFEKYEAVSSSFIV